MGNGASARKPQAFDGSSNGSSRKGSNSSISKECDHLDDVSGASDLKSVRSSYERYSGEFPRRTGSEKSLTGITQQSEYEYAVDNLGVYGQFVTLGHSAYEVKDRQQVPSGHQNLVFQLTKRQRGNGLKYKRSFLKSATEEKSHEKGEVDDTGADICPHTISMFLNQKDVLSHIKEHKILQNMGQQSSAPSGPPQGEDRTQCVQGASHLMVEYERDETRDMFQIGRIPQAVNDIVIPGPTVLQPRRYFTVSRYAARVTCSRDNPQQVSVFASGFNSKRQMVLSQNCPKWLDRNSQFGWDASTTNGLRVWYPRLKRWCDVSLQGKVRQNGRETECDSTPMIADEAVLSNGCVLDVGCAYLLFQDARAILEAQKFNLRKAIYSFDSLNKLLCPSFNSRMCLSLALCDGSMEKPPSSGAEGMPWVFTKCGHVTSEGDEKTKAGVEGQDAPPSQICPVCMMTGPFVRLKIQKCNGIYHSFPTCVFHPCGCGASFDAAVKWSQCPLRQILHRDFRRCCPFCNATLEEPRYSMLLAKSVARGEEIVSLEKLSEKLPPL